MTVLQRSSGRSAVDAKPGQPRCHANLHSNCHGFANCHAHNVPSDWRRADGAAGVLQRVTDMQGIGLHGTLPGSGGQVLFRSHQGLFTARADGSGLQHLMALETFGTVQWIP